MLEKIMKTIFSKQAFIVLMIVVLGLVLWFLGPLFSIGDLKPFASISIRITLIVLLVVCGLSLLFAWPISLVGVTAICILIWYAGPMLHFGEQQPLAAVASRVVSILVILFLYALYGLYRLWQAMRNDEELVKKFLHPANSKPKALAKEELKVVNSIFQKALAQLRSMRMSSTGFARLLEGKKYLYELPWYMLIGSPGAGKTTAILNSGLKFPIADQMSRAAGILASPQRGGTAYTDWWFTNEAVMIDTAGRYAMQESQKEKDPAEWHGFLELLRKHRARAPINGAIVMVNVAELLTDDATQRTAQAAKIRARLAELRAELGIQFPVYVIVTKMDLVEGFNEYFLSLTAEARSQVWGVTLPYTDRKTLKLPKINKKDQQGDTPKNTGFRYLLGDEFQKLAKRLEDGLNTRMQEEFEMKRRRSMYALPQEFEGLTHTLIEWLDDVFLDSLYDNTQLNNSLRGVYFTSAGQSDAVVPALQGSIWQRLKNSIKGSINKVPDVPFVAPDTPIEEGAETEEPDAQALNIAKKAIEKTKLERLQSTLPKGNRSYFLQDVFTKVIVPESNLVKPNLRWEFRFRLMRLVGHSLILILGIWLLSGLSLSFKNNDRYLSVINDKAQELKGKMEKILRQNSEVMLQELPDRLSEAEELPLYRGLDLEQPSASYRYGLYTGQHVTEVSKQTYERMQEQYILPFIIKRLELALNGAVTQKDSKAAYNALRIYLQLHDPDQYRAEDVLDWVRNDWQNGNVAQLFGGKSVMFNHVEQLFSGDHLVQAKSAKDENLVKSIRAFLDTNTSTERLYERAKAYMYAQAPDDFTLTRAAGAQASMVFTRASGLPIDKGISGIFTYDGYHNVFSKDLPGFIKQARAEDDWVMGRLDIKQDKEEAKLDFNITDETMDNIRQQYLTEYASLWEAYLADIRVVSGSNLTVDLNILKTLASPDSPLARFARSVARETTLSRPLFPKAEQDKSVLDKAEDKVAKTQKQISKDLGLRLTQRVEKELVDNRFSALRVVVTGQPDDVLNAAPMGGGSQTSGINAILGLLNEYYTFLTVANLSLNSNAIPPSANEISSKLRLEATKLPVPLNTILAQLAESGSTKLTEGSSNILKAQAQAQVDMLLNRFRFEVEEPCKRLVEGKYPFGEATQEASIDDFSRFFAIGGAADQFFQKNLLSYVDTSSRPWRYRKSVLVTTPSMQTPTEQQQPIATPVQPPSTEQPTILSEMLKLLAAQGPDPEKFAQVQNIQNVFFRDAGGKQMSWKSEIRVLEADPRISQLIVSVDGQTFKYVHDAIKSFPISWPGLRGGTMVEMQAYPLIKMETSMIQASGPWAIFRFVDKGRLINTAVNGSTAVAYSIDGRKVVLAFNSGGVPNPIGSSVLRNFKCPE